MATSTKSTTKRATRKSTTSTKKPVKKESSQSVVSKVTSLPKKMHAPTLHWGKLAVVLGVVLIVALLYFFQDKYLFAKVNGQPVTKLDVLNEMEKVKQNDVSDVVNVMIDKMLILQEAKKRNIVISDEEIDNEVKKAEAQVKEAGRSLDSELTSLGWTMDGLRENYKIQKSIEKMVGTVTVTDKEVEDYIEKNKEMIPEGQDEKTVRDQVKASLTEQKMNEKYQSFITELRKNGDVTTFRSYLNQVPTL